MKKYINEGKFALFVIVVAGASYFVCRCAYQWKHQTPEATVQHVHEWLQWGEPATFNNGWSTYWIQLRNCVSCGLGETREVKPTKSPTL